MRLYLGSHARDGKLPRRYRHIETHVRLEYIGCSGQVKVEALCIVGGAAKYMGRQGQICVQTGMAIVPVHTFFVLGECLLYSH